VFDTKTEKFTEWAMPTRWTNPDVTLDKNDDAWTGSMLGDRVVRLLQDRRRHGYCCRARPTSAACSWTTTTP
jgi:hypothetical protein